MAFEGEQHRLGSVGALREADVKLRDEDRSYCKRRANGGNGASDRVPARWGRRAGLGWVWGVAEVPGRILVGVGAAAARQCSRTYGIRFTGARLYGICWAGGLGWQAGLF